MNRAPLSALGETGRGASGNQLIRSRGQKFLTSDLGYFRSHCCRLFLRLDWRRKGSKRIMNGRSSFFREICDTCCTLPT